MAAILGGLIGPIAGAIISGMVQSPSIPVNRDNARAIEPAVRDAVAREVVPRMEHIANQEPWYQSRVTLGALASILSGVAGLFGWSIGAEHLLPVLVALGPILGGLFTLYGRWKAKKPIGA